MDVRRARDADLPAIAALQAESWRDAYADVFPAAYLAHRITGDLERHWRDLEIQPDDVVLVAEQDGLIGFIAVWCRPDPYIDNLHVRPSLRSRGTGSILMKAAAQQLIQKGHRTAYLWVVESNTRAIRFYERLGGLCTDEAAKDLYGHKVSTVKVEWADISVIGDRYLAGKSA
jgi:ribosomal protein S18 acetylase RimI-like enzyme